MPGPQRPPLARTTRSGQARLVVSTCLGVAVIAIGLPRVSGASWSAMLTVLGGVAPPMLVLLTLVWLAGLWVHTVALVAAMPGLTRGRAFYLNLTGSAASNVLPLGGAAGTAVNYWSCRQWGFSRSAFVRWAVVTNVWDNTLRLGLPTVAVAWLVLAAEQPTPGLLGLAVTGLLVLAAFLALVGALLHGSWPDRLLGRVAGLLVPAVDDPDGVADELGELRRTTRRLFRESAGRVAGGKLAYAVAQAVLLWLCLVAVGSEVPLAVVAAVFAVERLASLAVVTPGGSGLAEIGAVGVLVGFGLGGADAAAAVLLYRTFIFVLEIPGGVLLLALSSLRRRRPAARGSPTDQGPASVVGARAGTDEGEVVGTARERGAGHGRNPG